MKEITIQDAQLKYLNGDWAMAMDFHEFCWRLEECGYKIKQE